MNTPVWTGRSHLIAALLLTGLVAACYFNSLGNGFTYDDEHIIVSNERMRGWEVLPHLISPEYLSVSKELSYRPLVTLFHVVDYRLWGLRPFGFHLTNLLLHLGTTLLVYAFFVLLLNHPRPGPMAALLGAALFAVSRHHFAPQ